MSVLTVRYRRRYRENYFNRLFLSISKERAIAYKTECSFYSILFCVGITIGNWKIFDSIDFSKRRKG